MSDINNDRLVNQLESLRIYILLFNRFEKLDRNRVIYRYEINAIYRNDNSFRVMHRTPNLTENDDTTKYEQSISLVLKSLSNNNGR